MTLTINLQSDTEARLKAKAAREGRTAEEIVREAVEKMLNEEPTTKSRSILEFRGVGAHNPVGKDPQEYIKELRAEWDRRP